MNAPVSRFLKLNPKGKVPVIQNLDNNDVVYESALCDEYLCDVAHELDMARDLSEKSSQQTVSTLLPKSASGRAQLRLLNDQFDSKLGPAQFAFLMNKDPAKEDQLKQDLEQALTLMENRLEQVGGPYLMGGNFSLADVHVLPFFLRLVVSMKHFKGYELSKTKFPRLLEWFELCSTRESVRATEKTPQEIIDVYSKFALR